jgi:hypothetical protein
MQELLIRKLHAYIRENNPDLLWQLQQDNSVTDWLTGKIHSIAGTLDALLTQNKPAYFIEEECMELLTGDLRPSRFHYMQLLLEEEFPRDFSLLSADDLLENAVILLLKNCNAVFGQFGFSEATADDPLLRYTLTGLLQEYLHKTDQ